MTENHKGHITLDEAEKMMEKSQLSKGSGARRNIAARGMTYAKVLRQEIPQNMRGIKQASMTILPWIRKGMHKIKLGCRDVQDFRWHHMLLHPECNGKQLKGLKGRSNSFQFIVLK